MVQKQVPQVIAERRCPNCGTRVARGAESCFMCGHNLHIKFKRKPRVSLIDALLVFAVIGVLGVWWWVGSATPQDELVLSTEDILPTNIPVLDSDQASEGGTSENLSDGTEEANAGAVELSANQTMVTHKVQSGQTLLNIASLYDVKVEDIQAANNLNDAFIRAGANLIIPLDRPTTEDGSIVVASNFRYAVRQGDTLVSIAIAFGSTVRDIQSANGLSDDSVIRPDDILIIPVRRIPAAVLSNNNVVQPNGGNEGTEPTIYTAPRLIGPSDQATISREEVVLLRWISVDVLQPNEWYVLLIYPIGGAAQPVPTVWTKATSYRLDLDLAPSEGNFASYAWQISVVRVNPGVDGQRQLEAASVLSGTRNFTWK